MLTLMELLECEELKDFTVISGEKGLDREITSVSIVDAPDVAGWLKGGEILLTTGYIFKDQIDSFSAFLKKANDARAAAVFIKVGRFIEEVPHDMIDVSEKLQLPLIYMPFELAYTYVINVVLEKLLNRQNEVIQYSESIHKAFTGIAVRGEGIEEIVRVLSGFIRKPVMFSNRIFKCSYRCMDGTVTEGRESDEWKNYYNFPVCNDRELYGYIAVLEENFEPDEYELITIEHASTVIKLNIQKGISNMQIERQYKSQLVNDLIYDNIKDRNEIEQRCRLNKWEIEREPRVIITEFRNKKEELRIPSAQDAMEENTNVVIRQMKHAFPQALYTEFSDNLVFVVESELDDKAAIWRKLNDICDLLRQEYKVEMQASVGEKKQDLLEVHESFREAKRTRHLSAMLDGPARVNFYEDLGLYKLLDNLPYEKSLEEFANSYLESIIEYDKKFGTGLLDTLLDISDHNWNLKKTAQNTFVHYNTIKYRYHKIEEVAQIDFENTSEKLNMELSLKIYRMSMVQKRD